MNDVSKRLLEFYDYLKNENKIKNAADFCRKTKILPSSLNEIKQGRSNCGANTLQKTKDFYPFLNMEWLLTGKEKMINDATSLSLVENHLKNEAKSITYENNNKVYAAKEDAELYGGKKVPYYDVDFTSSFLEVENNQQNTPNYYISHPFFIGCDMVVRNSGQSMAKVIAHGDAIGLVRLNNWRDFFPFGEIYGIVTTDNLRMIKVITKGESENSYTLISKPTDSKKDEFPDQQIKIKSILHIFKVQASSHLF